MRTYKNQFPRYDAELLKIDGFYDSSWGNDICPSITMDLGNEWYCQIFCDYLDPKLREEKESARFFILHQQDNSYEGAKLMTDSEEEVRQWVKDNITNKKA